MRIDEIVPILCKLTNGYHEFKTEKSSVVYEFSERKYEITFNRVDGQFLNFQIEYIGAANEKN